MTRTLLAALPILALATAPARSQATLEFITGSGSATTVSADGQVLGLSSIATWTAAGGVVPIAGATGLVGLNFDGSIAGGTVDVGGADFIGFWNGVFWTPLPAFAGSTGCGGDFGSCYDISGSGTVLVGLGWENCKGRGYRYDPVGGVQKLKEGDFNGNRANCVSFDGVVTGGWDQNLAGTRRPARWLTATTLQVLGTNGEVNGLSADGSVAVGWEQGSAALWKIGSPIQVLPPLASALPGEPSFGLSTDGAGLIAVGQNNSFFTGPQTAWFYRDDVGTVDLLDLLSQLGAQNPLGYLLTSASDISLDGRTIVGTVDTFAFPFPVDAFRATLPDSWLRTDVSSVSATTGGSQVMTLNAGPERGNDVYFLLGSSSGTTPGFNLDGFNLPLNIDTYTSFTLNSPNTFISNSLGFFDSLGRATATLNVPANLNPVSIGLTFDHAYFVLDSTLFAVVETSMSASVTIAP